MELSQRTLQNKKYLEQAKSQGRASVRATLADRNSSEEYHRLAKKVSAKKLGHLISAMVLLASEAEKDGRLVIDEDGSVSLKDLSQSDDSHSVM